MRAQASRLRQQRSIFGRGGAGRRGLLGVVVAMAVLGCAAGSAAADPYAYVANSGDGTVTPIDLTTHTPGAAIPVGSDPDAIAITPNGSTAYVTDGSANTVTPINLTTTPAQPEPSIPVGGGPDWIAIAPNGQTAYVANSSDGTVTPINLANNQPEPTISAGYGPTEIAISPDGSTAYVTNYSGDGTVTPINLATNQPEPTISVGSDPTGIAITPDGRTAYVVNLSDDTVTPINLTTNPAQPERPITVGSSPFGIAITPALLSVKVSCDASSVVVGQSTTCGATVTDAQGGDQLTPSGTITFTSAGSGSSDTSSCRLSGAGTSASCSAPFTPTAADMHDVLTAAYAGDNAHPSASAQTPLDVSVRSDRVSISCPSSAPAGSQVSCTATVTDTDQAGTTSSPPGQITFTSNTSADVFSGSPCMLEPNGDNDSSSCSANVTLAAGKPHVHVIAARYGYYAVDQPGVGKTQITATTPRSNS